MLGIFSLSFSQGTYSERPTLGSVFIGVGTITDTDLNQDLHALSLGASSLPGNKLLEMGGTLSARWGSSNNDSIREFIQAYELSLIPKVNLFALFSRRQDRKGDGKGVLPLGFGPGAGIGYMVFQRDYLEKHTFSVQEHRKWYWDHLFLRFDIFGYFMLSKRIGLYAEYSFYHPITGCRLIRLSELRFGVAISTD